MYEAREQVLTEEIKERRGQNLPLVGTNAESTKSCGMTFGKLLILTGVGVCVASGQFLVNSVMSPPVETSPLPLMRAVPMALVDLEPGTTIRDSDIGFGPYPAGEIVEDMLLSKEALVGRTVSEPLEPGDVIHASQITRRPDAPPTAD